MPGHDHELLLGDAEVGEHRLHGGEDRVVAAPRAPADLLVGLEVLAGQDGQRGGHRTASSIIASTSDTLNGLPWILLNPCASIRYFARSTHTSCPMFISGTTTLR